MRGLPYTTATIPFVAGLNQKAEWRANQPPALDVALNVQFDDIGGIQLRKPYATLGSATTNIRKIVQFDDELLMFDDDTLYSWSPTTSTWVSRGTHLAVKPEEVSTFITTADQIECDRAELNNTVVISWRETVDHAGTTADVGYVAAYDKVTRAVIMTPRTLGGVSRRIRLVALSTKILLFFMTADGAALLAWALDPASPATALGGASTTILAAAAMNTYYDVEKLPGADSAIVVARRDTTTSYEVIKVTSALALTASTKARTCDGPIAVAASASSGTFVVARTNGTAIESDEILTSNLADTASVGISVGTATGAPVNQITAAFRSVADSGEFRCYIFWSAEEETGGAQFECGYNWVDTSGAKGTDAVFLAQMGIASRAFDYNGRVFVNLAFAGDAITDSAPTSLRASLQYTYFLYRDDQFLAAKHAAGVAGGHSPSTGHLPGVQSLGSGVFSWCGTERRRISLGAGAADGYADRGPREVKITFDSNEARRCVRFGQTLYIAGGELLQYDGTQLAEVGFHAYPWFFTAFEQATGAIEDGTYTYKSTYRWDNARGERDRSTTATHRSVDMAAAPGNITITDFACLRTTHKVGIAVEFWRTLKDPTSDSPFYLVTDQDPSNTSNPNRYEPLLDVDDPSELPDFVDELADADVAVLENNPENGGVLENLVPPPATIIAATDTRLFLAGVPADPHRVWYSKQRVDGEVAAFHEALTIQVPQPGGDITALAFLNETLYVFRETAIYMIPGDGSDNAGGGQNYGPAICVSADIGAVSAEAVALTPLGLLFKSSKGWYLLGGAQSVQYVGAGVADYDSESPVSIVVVEAQHQIRGLPSSRMLVLDYLVNQWAEWSVASGVDATMWRNTYVYTTSTQPRTESTTYSGVDYAMDVELAWWKPSDLLGDNKLMHFHVLGEYRGDHDLFIRVANDYLITNAGDPGSPTWHTSEYHSIRTAANGNAVGSPINLRVFSAKPNFMALKIRIKAVGASDHGNPPSGAACRLTGIALRYAPRNLSGARVPPPPSAPSAG